MPVYETRTYSPRLRLACIHFSCAVYVAHVHTLFPCAYRHLLCNIVELNVEQHPMARVDQESYLSVVQRSDRLEPQLVLKLDAIPRLARCIQEAAHEQRT